MTGGQSVGVRISGPVGAHDRPRIRNKLRCLSALGTGLTSSACRGKEAHVIRTAVIAIGGNSLITDKDHQRVLDQYQACSETCRHIAPLLRDPNLSLVITH